MTRSTLRVTIIVAIGFFNCVAVAATASTTSPAPKLKYAKVLAGWVENVIIPAWDIKAKAKLDTGAKTSSINAQNVEFFKKDGSRWVRFELVFRLKGGKEQRIAMERPRLRRVKVKEHDGNHDRRAVVEIAICFDGRLFNPQFTLADRSEFLYDVLLGREFLSGVAVIDPDKTFQSLTACPTP